MVERREILIPQKKSVVFLLYDQGSDKFLLERRNPKNENDEMRGLLVIPGGKVEEVDKLNGGDYFLNAMFREVDEEFSVKPRLIVSLLEKDQVTLNKNFYRTKVYLVLDWKGQVANKEGKHEFNWVSVDEAEELMPIPLSREIVRAARTFL